MADLGDSSKADTGHKHKTSSWITVAVLIASTVVLAFAFILQSVWLAVVGGVLGIAGIVLGVVGRIMEDAY